MAARPLSVAVHSARRLIGEALAMCLSTEPDLVVAGHTQDWAQLAVLCRLRRPEVLVVEAADAPERTVPALAELTRRWPAMMVVLVSPPLTSAGSATAAAAGVQLLVPYERGLAVLLAILRAQRAKQPVPRHQSRAAQLTDRELEVLRLVGTGLTVAEIGRVLGIGRRSVENHKRRIFTKLDINSQAMAVSSMAALGLLDPRPRLIGSGVDLTTRERELLKLAAAGASTRQMASSLGVAPKTIESHLSGLYRKLGVHNRAAALTAAHALGLVATDDFSSGNRLPPKGFASS